MSGKSKPKNVTNISTIDKKLSRKTTKTPILKEEDYSSREMYAYHPLNLSNEYLFDALFLKRFDSKTLEFYIQKLDEEPGKVQDFIEYIINEVKSKFSIITIDGNLIEITNYHLELIKDYLDSMVMEANDLKEQKENQPWATLDKRYRFLHYYCSRLNLDDSPEYHRCLTDYQDNCSSIFSNLFMFIKSLEKKFEKNEHPESEQKGNKDNIMIVECGTIESGVLEITHHLELFINALLIIRDEYIPPNKKGKFTGDSIKDFIEKSGVIKMTGFEWSTLSRQYYNIVENSISEDKCIQIIEFLKGNLPKIKK